MAENDLIHHPHHYTQGRIEVKDFIVDQDLNFFLGNAIKYIARHKHKGKPIEDLQKAKKYLDFEIEFLQKKEKDGKRK